MQTIKFIDEDDNVLNLSVLDEVTFQNKKYLLVADEHEQDEESDDEIDAFILKQKSEKDEDVIYEIIEDEQEYLAVLELFRGNNDDYDFDYEQ